MTGPFLPPAYAEALDDLEHNCDLLGVRPLPCEIAWAFARVRDSQDGEKRHDA